MIRYLLVFLLFSTLSFAQSISFKGKVLDSKTQVPLEAVTVYFTSVKDSSMTDYTLTDKNGNFVLNTRVTATPQIFKVSFVGYTLFERQYPNGLKDNFDYGTIKLEEVDEILGEVVVKAEAPPIRIKNDTLEFNAKSFKIRPDATVESLIKQLPGVEIDEDGKIKVNGKEVNQILVNGKPFFDKDGKIALQNLPADLINKVQVTDYKTKKEEQTGQASSSNNASINLTIDEDKNKGLFGKFMGGYGTDDRYESSLMLNYFKGARKLSLLASANNINSTGFSMNEIFDSMGGGRNYSVWTNDDGSFGINGMRFGGGGGITESHMVGLNYGDELYKDAPVSASYFYNGANTVNNRRFHEERFIPSGNLITDSQYRSESDKYAHNIRSEAELKIDSLTNVFIAPRFMKAGNLNTSNGSSVTVREDGSLANEVESDQRSDQKTSEFATDFSITRKLKKGYLSFSGNLSTRKDDTDDYTRNLNTRYTDTDGDGLDEAISDNRNQLVRDRIKTDEYFGELEYSRNLKDSISLNLGIQYNSVNTVRDREGLEYNAMSGMFDVDMFDLTHQQRNQTITMGPRAGLSSYRKNFYFRLTAGTDIVEFRNRSLYQGVNTTLDKQYMVPTANLYGNYSFTKSMKLWMNYNYQVMMPQGSQILPIVDVSNPLQTLEGNPDLDPNKYHNAYLSLRDYDFATKSGWTLYVGGQIYENQIVSSTVYDEGGKAYTTYVNVEGTSNTYFGGSYSRSFKREEHKYRIGLNLSSGYSKNAGFVDGLRYTAKAWRYTPKLTFSYDYGELLNIAPNYQFTYNSTNYENLNRQSENSMRHQLSLQTTAYWPKNVVFGNDFSYNYNSRMGDGFKKDFYLWNLSLGYYFLDKTFLAKVKVYDLLDQNQNQMRNITANSIRDEQNDVLKRYVMFSLTYSLTKFGGKEKKTDFMMFH